MQGLGPHKPKFAYDIVRIHSLMIYTDIVEYNVVGETKAPSFLRCFPFNPKIESVRCHYYRTKYEFSSVLLTYRFRHLINHSFHNIHIVLRDTTGEKIPFVSVGITRLVLVFRKVSEIQY